MTLQPPYENELAWDQISFAGQLWEGIVDIDGAERPYDWQKNKGKGTSGATLNFNGVDLATPKVTFKLWKGTDRGQAVDYFARWDDYRKIFIKTVDPKNPIALDVQHPVFDQSEIRSVIVTNVGQIKPTLPGAAEIIVSFEEYRAPAKAGGTPKSSATKTDTSTPLTDAEKAVIAEKAESAALMFEANRPDNGGSGFGPGGQGAASSF